MAFWDKVKGVANDAMNTLSDAAKDVTESAKEMNEKSKINRAIKVEEGKINNLYMVMGEKFLMKILLHLPVLKISLPESIQLKMKLKDLNKNFPILSLLQNVLSAALK